jgi:hypothetical protein
MIEGFNTAGKEILATANKASPLNSKCNVELPQSVIDSFARFLVPEIRKYYESEEGKKAFEKWQQENG